MWQHRAARVSADTWREPVVRRSSALQACRRRADGGRRLNLDMAQVRPPKRLHVESLATRGPGPRRAATPRRPRRCLQISISDSWLDSLPKYTVGNYLTNSATKRKKFRGEVVSRRRWRNGWQRRWSGRIVRRLRRARPRP